MKKKGKSEKREFLGAFPSLLHRAFTFPTSDHRVIRFLLRLLLWPLLLLSLAFAGTAAWTSGRLLFPTRRAMQNYHQEILSQPARYGLHIERYTGPQGTPCLLITPSPNPGAARKSRLLRELLAKSGVIPPPWGKIRGTLVLLHGYQGRKEDNLPVAERFCAAGFRCLIPDLPGHGDHPAATATFGKNEVGLVNALLDDAARRFRFAPKPAGLFGISQGGAIALQTAAQSGDRWQAVASVAAFASLDQPVHQAALRLSPELDRISPFTETACASGVYCRAGFTPAGVRPVDDARHLRIPAFIAHGEDDRFIPPASGQAIFDAIPHERKTFRFVKGADHHDVLAVGSNALYAELCAFLLRSL